MDSNRSDRQMKKKMVTKTRILLLVLAIVISMVGLAGGYIIGLLNKMDRVELDKESLGVNNKLTNQYSYIKNIALLGVDNADGSGGRSDSMMIATIDTKNKKLKVTSLMRDMYVEIPGFESHKLNSAYSFGREETAIKTINEVFDLNIEDFVTVDFRSLPKVIDKIGGVEIEVDSTELKHLNDYINDLNGRTGTNSSQVLNTGIQNLNGVQAMAYCRIRYTQGDDFKRTERQREVINSMLDKIFTISPTKYPSVLNDVMPMVKTSLSTGEILDVGKDVISIGNNLEQSRFPMDGDFKFETIKGMSCIVFDRDVTVEKLHNWIFEDIDENADTEIDVE